MTNNDILRRLRYAFDFNDRRMMALFELGGATVTRQQVSAWLKRSEDPSFVDCENEWLSRFLNGLILHKRGTQEGTSGPPPAELELTNNLIFRKLKIALNLREADTLEMLQCAGMKLSRPELSALFRKPDHKHYRACQDQILRNFLRGLQFKLRPGQKPTAEQLGVSIVRISAEQTVDLRHRVLWPDEPIDFVRLPEDAQGLHYGLIADRTIVSVVSLFITEGKARFRKFATDPQEQGKGYGTLLLEHLITEAKRAGAAEFGCRARVDKMRFYEKFELCSTEERSTLGSVQYVYMRRDL